MPKPPRPTDRTRRAGVVGVALVAYSLGLVALVATPIGWWLNRLTVFLYICLLSHFGPIVASPEMIGVALNVLLFVPLGVLLRGVMGSLPALATATAATVAIECVQLWPSLGREASASDLLANTVGAALGIGLAATALRIRNHRQDHHPHGR